LRSKVKVTANENVKIVSRARLREKWIDFRQNQTKIILVPFHIVEYISPALIASTANCFPRLSKLDIVHRIFSRKFR